MKIIKVLSLICFLTITILAQTGATISGIASDLQKPLANSKVVLVSETNQTRETQTDAKGYYIFENVAAGKYRISVLQADNNTLISKQIEVTQNDLTIDLTYGNQRPSDIKYGEVTVIAEASRKRMPSSKIAVS